jgi:hypothetical protein
LVTMRERAELMQAELTVHATPGRGTEVRVVMRVNPHHTLPLPLPASAAPTRARRLPPARPQGGLPPRRRRLRVVERKPQ